MKNVWIGFDIFMGRKWVEFERDRLSSSSTHKNMNRAELTRVVLMSWKTKLELSSSQLELACKLAHELRCALTDVIIEIEERKEGDWGLLLTFKSKNVK
jgi:hypothetical protein